MPNFVFSQPDHAEHLCAVTYLTENIVACDVKQQISFTHSFCREFHCVIDPITSTMVNSKKMQMVY